MENNFKTEIIDIEEIKNIMPKKVVKIKDKIIYRYFPTFLIPFLITLSIISLHSTHLIIKPINYIVYLLLIIIFILMIIGIIKNKTQKIKSNIIFKIFIFIYVLGCTFFITLLYGPYDGFRNWLITTAMKTGSHQYLCKWFYNDNEINTVINGNYIIEIDEETDISLIDKKEEIIYENEYEKQVLDRNKNDKYKIIELEVNGQKAYLAVIYDPSKITVGVTSRIGVAGQYATKMALDHKALLGVNGGGFYDPGNNSTGGMPTGVTISNGKVITDNNYSTETQSGGLIGFNKDNILVLMKYPTAKKALEANIRDGVSWGPFLIVNGKESFVKGNGGWGYAARTAIGQRKDGIVLLLVVNINATRTKGADMVDLTQIMKNYGAINAANLDGGTSSVMVLPKKEALKYRNTCDSEYCYINDPIDSTLSHRTRGIATTILLNE